MNEVMNNNPMMTWEEICEKYPYQWVALKNYTYKDNGVDILTARVALAGSKAEVDDYFARHFKEGVKCRLTGESAAWIGVTCDEDIKIKID